MILEKTLTDERHRLLVPGVCRPLLLAASATTLGFITIALYGEITLIQTWYVFIKGVGIPLQQVYYRT